MNERKKKKDEKRRKGEKERSQKKKEKEKEGKFRTLIFVVKINRIHVKASEVIRSLGINPWLGHRSALKKCVHATCANRKRESLWRFYAKSNYVSKALCTDSQTFQNVRRRLPGHLFGLPLKDDVENDFRKD